MTTSTTTGTTGIVLFAHGSRDPLWHKPMEAVAKQIRQQEPNAVVACAYLELSQPDLPTVVASMVGQGLQAVRIVPMFLGVGKHAREDLPQLAQALRAAHPQLTLTLQSAVGENPQLVELLARIALNEA